MPRSRVPPPLEMVALARALAVRPVSAVRKARAGVVRMRRAVSRSPRSLFLRELMAQPLAVGAICASSPHLAARMAAQVDLAAGGWVVELGGGTGVITAALLAHGVPPERLAVVEQSDRLAAHLRQRFPAIHVLHGDAAELPALLAQLDGPAAPVRVQHIVSGLPLLSIPTPVRQRILHAGAQVLAPGGRLLQFTYALHGPSPWQQAGLVCQRRERVLANLPPARVDVLGHALSA
ncbi:MAG: methyltransferase domain-containing protein [Burkholderiaceae bacterium]|nr:methyltransferase domain-containing protein [Burkholderiaceae bacterium]MCP5217213.1 methyltransferase domain-containing protein [Burkholderiaceae bacterium]